MFVEAFAQLHDAGVLLTFLLINRWRSQPICAKDVIKADGSVPQNRRFFAFLPDYRTGSDLSKGLSPGCLASSEGRLKGLSDAFGPLVLPYLRTTTPPGPSSKSEASVTFSARTMAAIL
jgi:hypothetical protein